MSTNLTKREIVLDIYRKAGFPQKQIVDTVQQTLDIIQNALAAGRNVELRNFGVLEVQVRKQRREVSLQHKRAVQLEMPRSTWMQGASESVGYVRHRAGRTRNFR